jgi:Ino eighty subunit 2
MYCTAESSRKKKQLNEAEIALRREETARKRRNMSEKKLEDEKARVLSLLTYRAYRHLHI